MAEPAELAPWSHPKAQRWFETLLDRSGLVNEIEDRLSLDVDLELGEARMLTAILILMGRPGIWPEKHQTVMQRAALKVSKAANAAAKPGPEVDQRRRKKKKPLSLEEHQLFSQALEAIKSELELLRRRANISKRKTKMDMPVSWGEFWG